MFLTKVMSLFLSGTLLFSIPISPMSILSGLFSKEKNYTVFSDIKYGDAERNLIDIYVPKSSYKRDYNAVILFIHGGSWNSGDKKDMNAYCEDYAEKGYITATMSYTLVTEDNSANAFTMLDEIDLAINKIKEFSNQEKLNITKLATCGYSSGGHISSLYAYTRGQNSAIKLAFTANKVSPSDFHNSNWGENYGDGMGYNLACALAGVKFDESFVSSGKIEEIIDSVSPARHINKNSVPTIAGYGGKDTVCPIGNAYATKAALVDSGIDYEFIMYTKSNHALMRDPSKAAQYKETFLSYCEKYFGYAPLNVNSQNTLPTESATKPENQISDGGNNRPITDNVIKPNESIPNTNNDVPDNEENGAFDQKPDDNSQGQDENLNNQKKDKSDFKYKREVIFSVVLLAVILCIFCGILIMRRKSAKQDINE